MPIVQPYRDCKCVKDCWDAFQESVHYSYYPLNPGQVGVMHPNEDILYIMSEELFWENFTDPNEKHERIKGWKNKSNKHE